MTLLLCGAGGCSGGGSNYDPSRPQQDTPTTATYKTARCTDGSYTYSKQPEIFCASRGGIDQRYDRPK